MRIIKVTNYDEVSVRDSKFDFRTGKFKKPDAVLGLATGGSPVGAYKRSWKHITTVRLIFPGLTINLMNTEESKETTNRATGVLCRKICLNM